MFIVTWMRNLEGGSSVPTGHLPSLCIFRLVVVLFKENEQLHGTEISVTFKDLSNHARDYNTETRSAEVLAETL